MSDKQNQDDNSLDLATAAAGSNEFKRQAIEMTESARDQYQLPSFGKKLFDGHFDSALLFPFPLQSQEDQQIGDLIIQELMDYLEKHLDPEEVDATRTIPDNVIQEMKRIGIFALKVPKEYGGLGLSQINYCKLVAKVASFCGSTAVLISAHQSIGVPQPLKMFGTDSQKKRFLPRFRAGSISAFALTEPEIGSDPAQMSSTATLSEDKKTYLLNGKKLWCTNGTIADIIVVMAQTAPKMINGKECKQISAFIVEMNTPGIEILHRCEFMGLGGIYNGLINFTNVKIPAENLLWEEGKGLRLALTTINVGRLTLPAACTGAAKQCLSIARRFGATRIQWGMPIGLHESGREKIAYIAATTLAMEAVSWLTCAWADEKKVDIRIEAAMAKLFCSEAIWKIADLTMQLRGGRGYEKGRSLKKRGEVPFPVERIMRDCRINTILEGSSEIMRLFLAREAIDSHLKRSSSVINPKSTLMQKLKGVIHLTKFYAVWYPKQLIGSLKSDAYPYMGVLACHFRFIERQSHKLARKLFALMVKYRHHLERKQMLLGRLMDIGTDLFVMAATCSYAKSLEKIENNQTPLELADYFCQLAKRRIKNNFDALDDNDDNATNCIAKKVIEKSYPWLEKGIVWMGADES